MSPDSVSLDSVSPDSASTPTTLTIAVLTFRRPDDLRTVLPLLVEQAASVSGLGVDARVLVVDNDESASARGIVEASTALYAHEPVPGISSARNRALRESATSDLLVFIDDDERPGADWLASLVALQRAEGAAAVVGPVVSEFAHEPDPWIVAGRFFERRRLATGTEVEVAATNNLLLDLGCIREWGLEFDVALGALGGEDTLFTRAIRARGGRMLWCAEALVTDVVPPERLTRQWVVRRAYSSGNAWSLTTLMTDGGTTGDGLRIGRRLELSARGAVRLAGGVARLAVGTATRSLSSRARGVRTLARGAGMVTGAWGSRYREYARD